MRIAVVGGGPAGLFFARLVKRHDPSAEIDIFEQNPANATYGFGVTLAGPARDRLRKFDEEALDRLADCMVLSNSQLFTLNDEKMMVRYAGSGGAIARLQLLEVMTELCREVGLQVEHEKRIHSEADLKDYDLVVGADGANSVVRGFWEESFKPKRRQLGNWFAWYGVGRALKNNGLSFKKAAGGCFIGHYYAYTDSKSTFVAECDSASWQDAGLDRMTNAERKALIEEIYAEDLEGDSLLENKSEWRQFNAIVAENWYHGNAVLLGDALRVAHFSIGSGTRLAMDDSLALFEALRDNDGDVEKLTADYVERRKATRDLFTEATVRSFEWYEDVREKMDTDIVSFIHDFLTRTGRVDEDRLKVYAPEFYRDHVEARLSVAGAAE